MYISTDLVDRLSSGQKPRAGAHPSKKKNRSPFADRRGCKGGSFWTAAELRRGRYLDRAGRHRNSPCKDHSLHTAGEDHHRSHKPELEDPQGLPLDLPMRWSGWDRENPGLEPK